MDFNKEELKKLEASGQLKELPGGKSVDEFIKELPTDDTSKDTFDQSEIDDILKLIGS